MADMPTLPTPDLDAEFTKAFTPKTAAQIPPQAANPMPQATGAPVNVINPEGRLVSIPSESLQNALANGYQQATDQHVADYERHEKYGTLGQQITTGAEGAASAATFGLSTGLEKALGVPAEDIRAREEENPGSHMIGQGAGLVASSMLLPGGGAAGVLGKAGEAGAKAIGLGAEAAGTAAVIEAANAGRAAGLTGDALAASIKAAKVASQVPFSAVEKIGSAAVKGAVENALFQSGDEVSKMLSSDNGDFSETALADIGLAGLIGGTLGGAIGTVHPLWEAAEGSKVGRVLKALTDKSGGNEAATVEPKLTPVEPLKNLPKASPGPNEAVRQAAADYSAASGTPLRQADEYVKADPKRGAAIAQAFEQMQHAPNDPAVKQAYDALIRETLSQYQAVKKMGLKIDPIEAGAANPYPEGSKQVLEDIKNGHLWYFPTDQGFGTAGAEIADHPLMAPTAETLNGKPMLANDVFRIVHDVFGHAKEGNGFGPHGEENAWNAHVRMYSPEAAKAMTTETRGQNSWVNYGPHGDFNQAFPEHTKYADQKAGLLPDWVMTDGLAQDRTMAPHGKLSPEQAMDHTITTSGMDLPPEIRAGLSSDPEVQQWFSTLNQSDTTDSGRKLQASMTKFRADAGEGMAKSLGKTVEEIPDKGELDKYTTGKKIGNQLAQEYHEQIDPLAKEYEAKRIKYSSEPLTPDRSVETPPDYSNPYMPSSGHSISEPGTVSQIAEKIVQRAQSENWLKMMDSDIARNVNKVLDTLPKQKTLNDLSGLESSIGAEFNKNPLDKAMTRAGGIIKSILRDAEADVIAERLGKDAPETLARFQALREAYGKQAGLKEALDDRLHAKGSTAGYAKSIRELAHTDGETVLRRLSGVNDAELLDILKNNFPKTAEMVKEYHINNVLSAAKDGDMIRGERLVKALYSNQMSPQLRDFIAKPEALNRINAISHMLEKFNAMPHNYSNTARTIDKLFQFVPGSATTMVAMLTGHNPVIASILGHLQKPLAKDGPDAIRLAMLKFMGSDAPISAGAFKSTVDAIHATIKGESNLAKGVKNLFVPGRAILSESQMPKESDTQKLDKQLKKIQTDPQPLLKVAGSMGHYLPGHAEQMGEVASRATSYLNSIRPDTTRKSPLDAPIQLSPVEKASYNNALKIAVQPLVVLDKIQKGMLTVQDMQHFTAMYPALHARLADKITAQIADTTAKGDMVPYKTRVSMSMFMAQPLDSTMAPGSILSAQPLPAAPPQPQGKDKGSALNKLPKSYQTASQEAESDRSDRS